MIRILRVLEFLFRLWRARAANESKRWRRVVDVLGPSHARGMRTEDTSYMVGCALCSLGEWEHAVDEFELIQAPLEDEACERIRHYNHALALSHIGRTREAQDLLSHLQSLRLPPEMREHSKQLVLGITSGERPHQEPLH